MKLLTHIFAIQMSSLSNEQCKREKLIEKIEGLYENIGSRKFGRLRITNAHRESLLKLLTHSFDVHINHVFYGCMELMLSNGKSNALAGHPQYMLHHYTINVPCSSKNITGEYA